MLGVSWLVKSRCKLLLWLDEHLQSLAIHLECSRQSGTFPLDHLLGSPNHVSHDLALVDFDFTHELVVLLHYALVLSACALDSLLDSLDPIKPSLLRLQLHPLHPVLLSRNLPVLLNLIHLGHHLPRDCVLELIKQHFQVLSISRDCTLRHQDHKYSLELPGSNLLPQVCLLLSKYITLQVSIIGIGLLIFNSESRVGKHLA